MLRGRWWDLWGPATLWAYAKLIVSGRRLQNSQADVSQLGGNVLVDPDGIVRLHQVGSEPADRPTISSIIAVVEDFGSQY